MSGAGNHYDYGFRVYNPRIGKFLSVDPLFQTYPWFTPYQFSSNTPIWAIDLDGLEAWLGTNLWNKDTRNLFVSYVTDLKFPQNKKRTCEDFVIELIFDFAEANSLKLKIVDYSKEVQPPQSYKGKGKAFRAFFSDSKKYSDANSFKYDAMNTFYAENFRNSGLFYQVGETKLKQDRLNIQTGDVLFSMRNGEAAHHVQLVVERGVVTQEMVDKWKAEGKTHLSDNLAVGDHFATIIQGNFSRNESPYIPNEGDPESIWYVGSEPQKAYYNLSTDSYTRDYGDYSTTGNWGEREDQTINIIDSERQADLTGQNQIDHKVNDSN